MTFNTILKIFFLYTIYNEIFLQLAWPPGFCLAPLNIPVSSGYGSDWSTYKNISQSIHHPFEWWRTRFVAQILNTFNCRSTSGCILRCIMYVVKHEDGALTPRTRAWTPCSCWAVVCSSARAPSCAPRQPTDRSRSACTPLRAAWASARRSCKKEAPPTHHALRSLSGTSRKIIMKGNGFVNCVYILTWTLCIIKWSKYFIVWTIESWGIFSFKMHF